MTSATKGLLFLSSVGIGVCYVLIDMFATVMRRPALAGLPMLAIYVVPVMVDTKSVSILTFLFAGCGFLWLLVSDSIDRVRLFGRRFTGDGRGVDMWETSPLASVGRRLTAVGIAAAVLLPGVLPGVGSGLINDLGGSGGGGGGTCVGVCVTSGRVNLFTSLQGTLSQSPETKMLTVQTKDPLPYYLRMAASDQLTKTGFHSPTPSGGPIDQNANMATSALTSGLTYQKYHAKVDIQALNMPYLPVYLQPVTKSITGVGSNWAWDPGSYTVFSTQASTKGSTYTFDFEQPSYDPAALAQAAPIPATSTSLQQAASVPETVPAVDAVLKSHTKDAQNEYQTVLDLVNYFKTSGFTYKLSTKTGTTGTDIGDFLQNKQGYCLQYATALAWLVRAAHYPARVAFGFTGGTTIASSGTEMTYQMTGRDLHAWTEVYFEGFGWVPFDVTPASGITGAVHTAWDDPSQETTGAHGRGLGSSASPAPDGGDSPSAQATRPDTTPISADTTPKPPTPPWVWWTLGAIGLLLLLTVSPAIARSMQRARRYGVDNASRGADDEPGQPWVVVDDDIALAAVTRRVHAVWDEFLDTLVDFDVAVDPSESPRTTAERVVRTTDLTEQGSEGVRAVGRAEETARYARRAAATPSLARDVRRFRRELAENVSFGIRLRAAVFPPSVTGRWRQRVTGWFSQINAFGSGTREAVRTSLRISERAGRLRRLLGQR